MSEADNLLDLDAAGAFDDLLDAWFQDRPPSVTKADAGLAYGPVIFAHVAHVHLLAQGVQTLYEKGLSLAAMPLIRQMIEFTFRAMWIEIYRENLPAVIWDGERQRHLALQAAADTGQIPLDDPSLANVRDWCLQNEDVKAATSGRKFELICEEIEGGKSVYAHYRMASNLTHASSVLTDNYIFGDTDQTSGVSFRTDPELNAPSAWFAYCATMLVYAGLCWDRVDRSHHHRSIVRKWATRFGVSKEPVPMSDIGFKRWNAASTARAREKKARSNDGTPGRSQSSKRLGTKR